jgi:hypothetical protein
MGVGVGLGDALGDGLGDGLGLGPTCACAWGTKQETASAITMAARKPLARPRPAPAPFAREAQRINSVSKEQRQPKNQ